MGLFRRSKTQPPSVASTPTQSKTPSQSRSHSHPELLEMPTLVERDEPFFSKSEVTASQHKAIVAALRPTVARQRAQSPTREPVWSPARSRQQSLAVTHQSLAVPQEREPRSWSPVRTRNASVVSMQQGEAGSYVTRERDPRAWSPPRARKSSVASIHQANAAPRMSKARMSAARAYWDPPIAIPEWCEHPSTKRMVRADSIATDSSCASHSTHRTQRTDSLQSHCSHLSPSASNDEGYVSGHSVQSEVGFKTVEWTQRSSGRKGSILPDPLTAEKLEALNKLQRLGVPVASVQVTVQEFATPEVPAIFESAPQKEWKTPGEETRAFIAQLEGSATSMGVPVLKRSRSMPFSHPTTSDGSQRAFVNIDGGSMAALATFAVPSRDSFFNVCNLTIRAK